jgi:cytochrome c-type biogenesis protein CcmH/NrfG
VGAPPTAPSGAWQRLAPAAPRAAAWQGLWWTTLAVAGIFCFITFYAKGGLNLESMTTTEMALTLGAGVLVAAGAILAPAGTRAYGMWPVGLLLAFTALSGISIVWSVQPDHSWQDSGRLLAYSGVFAAGVALVRLAPGRWAAVLGGLALAAVVVCAYAVATKVFPASLAPSDTYARLNEPYGYWNAVGLTAAMGAICCLWLGARRTGHALLRALAYPAMGLLLLTLVLAYSRGALAALAVGLALWFCVVPLRLRGATLLIVGALGAGAVAAWDFSRHALSSEGVALAQRDTAGHQLGALVVAMLTVLAIVGVAVGFLTARRAPSPRARRRGGAALLAAIVLVLIAFAGALAHSHRGLVGSVSHAVGALTNPNAKPPPNTPGRLTAVASVRARYWKEGLQVFDAHPLGGAGAEGYATAHLRYETGTLEVRHAHSFIVQTLADLGLVGLLVALALLFTWMASAWRACRSPAGYTPERISMLSMLSVVVVFGAHSTIDWTWYVPGDACVALLCAGWLAGRGALHASAGSSTAPTVEKLAPPTAATDSGWRPRLGARSGRGERPSYTRVAVATAAIVAALLAAWSQWQPLRSEEASLQADSRLEAHDSRAALAAADAAAARDPLSVEALFTLSSVQRVSGEPARARATLERAVRLQPSNPQTWLALGRYDLQSTPANPRAAVKELQAAIYLNPESISPEAVAAGNREAIETHNDYIQALQAAAQRETVKSAGEPHAPAAGAARPAGRRHRARRSP